MQQGYNNYIKTRWLQNGLSYSDLRMNMYATLQQTQCTYYDSIAFDLSQFGSLFGKDCETYILTDTEAFPFEAKSPIIPIFTQILLQDRSYLVTTWSVQSLDIVLGLIGGFVGLIWDLLGYSLGGYESFKFSTALISEIYSTTDKSRMMKDSVPDNHADACTDLKKGLETQARYEYSYREYFCSWLLLKPLCCFKSCLRKR